MSETMFYMLYALREERHGYAIMRYVEEITTGRIVLGPGTIYQTLSKLEKERLIIPTIEENRQKKYILTSEGQQILREEAARITKVYELAKELL